MERAAQEPREQQEPRRTGVSRRALLFGGATVVAAATVGTAGLLGLREPRAPAGELSAVFVDGPLPVTDPTHDVWGEARHVEIALQPQQMAPPWLGEATLDRLAVRALYNGTDLGLLLEWDDPEVDRHEGIATFRDAVAAMLPTALGGEEPPPIFMGWEGQPVYLAHWKASWQLDLDERYQDVGDIYPGWFNDVHPGHDTLTDLGLDAEAASVYAPGRHVGNPLSQRDRPAPVEELSAEGFGTLTHLPEQHASGRGVHDGRMWHVTLGIPGGRNAPELPAGRTVPISFAVWHGSEGQVGARKQYADWTELTLPEA